MPAIVDKKVDGAKVASDTTKIASGIGNVMDDIGIIMLSGFGWLVLILVMWVIMLKTEATHKAGVYGGLVGAVLIAVPAYFM